MPPLRLLEPMPDLLDRYAAALRHGFEPRGRGSDLVELRALEAHPAAFLAARSGRAPTLCAARPRERWIFDVVACDFVGRLDMTARLARDLSPIRVVIAPWWRRRGYGSGALALALAQFSTELGPDVLLACDAGDEAAARTIMRQVDARPVGLRRVAASDRLVALYRVPLGPTTALPRAA